MSEPLHRDRQVDCDPAAEVRTPVYLHGAVGWLAALALLAGCRPSPAPQAPVQPIAFVHSSHIEAGLSCTRCHAGAERGIQAGLPALSVCASCHRRSIPDHPEVQKVLAAYEAKEPIRWVKVNVLPSTAMVHFNHRAHARAGVVCEECHGEVATMALAEPVIDTARMGWCLDCHRELGASDDCLTCHR